MLKYLSNKGGSQAVDFETAILDGFASDGGLYVPEILPKLSVEQLENWSKLGYTDLAFEILSLFIDRSIISDVELRNLLKTAYADFEKKDIISLHPLKSRKNTFILELFHGPTLSFKDIGQAFLVNLVHFFLERKSEKLSLIVATTGDTGPAAAYFTAGKATLDAWVLYPTGMITKEQERQMTTLPHSNIHPVSVSNCPEGGDDLDLVIAKLYANKEFKEKVKLSSVNSINWGRVMMQMVHYFYAYFQVVDVIGEKVNISVPSGGFGNLCGGALGREMGLPIETFVSANNDNATLHRIFSQGIFIKKPIYNTISSAIDILIPYNFWRYLYFIIGNDAKKIKAWQDEFVETGSVKFDKKTYSKLKKVFLSHSASDQETLDLIKEIYVSENYLLDPHGAVALAAADAIKGDLNDNKMICLATAHPAKFPAIIQNALGINSNLPTAASHVSIEKARNLCQKLRTCDYAFLEEALIHSMSHDF